MRARRVPLQFSLLTLFGLVTIVALGCAALRSPSELWASSLFTFTIVVLLAAILRAILRRGPARAFWIGFALFGWGYLLLIFGPWFGRCPAPPLLSTEALTYLQAKLHKSQPAPPQMITAPPYSQMVVSGGSGGAVTTVWSTVSPAPLGPAGIDWFQSIGHSLLAQFAGILGGVLACLFYTGPRDPSAAEASREAEPDM
jgi:hypothetical protein